jgi:quercetin dioxygenase-like cupin family protein
MHISNLEKAKKTKVNIEGAKGVYKQIVISKENGAPTFSFRVFTIEPGGYTPLHHHPFEQMNYIIEGNGSLIVQGQKYDLTKGVFALVLPDEEHQYRNTSAAKPMVMICAVPKEYE